MFKYLNNKRKKKGQSTLEYAILVVIIIGALVSIQVYIKRSIQGRLKSAADDIGDQFSNGNTNVISVMTVKSTTRDIFKLGVTNSTLLADEITNDNMTFNVINVNQEYWGDEQN